MSKFKVKNEDYLHGDDWETSAVDHEHAAELFAEKIDETGELLENDGGTEAIVTDENGVQKTFKVSASPEIVYRADEVKDA
jgi:hypothetical protein